MPDRRAAAIVATFFALRIPLLQLRAPFYDELFTKWIAGKSFVEIVRALTLDSGPPLYYFLVHVFGHGRGLSLAFATVALVALLYEKRYRGALFLAVFPPAVLFAVDARAYALCAMFVAIGLVAIDRQRPYMAASAFVLAAYSHYYGVLFFPVVLLGGAPAWSTGLGRSSAAEDRLKPVLHFGALLLLFLPGFWLALHQPRAAMAWVGKGVTYPESLFARPPILLLVIIIALLVAVLRYVNRFTWMTIIPAVLAIPVYVPLRLESVIASPLSLWLDESSKRVNKWVFVGLVACCATWSAIGVVEHATRPPDDYRDVAMRVRDAREPVVASGYLYLETINVRPAIAFPPEQAQHPGWRVNATSGSSLPSGSFLWVGERGAPEYFIIRQTRVIEPLYSNARAMIARVR